MVFSKEDKVVINDLGQEKDYGVGKLINKFPNKNLSPSSLNKLRTKFSQTGIL